MARNRRGLRFTGSTGLLDRSKGGSAMRRPSSGLSLGDTVDLSNTNATPLTGTGSSHVGQRLRGSANGNGFNPDPLGSALTRKGLGILRDTPTSIYKTPEEEEQYYRDSIRRLNESADVSRKQAEERAISSGLLHSGALVGEFGDIGERLVTATGEQLRALKKEDREFADQSLVSRTGLAAGIQGQVAGQEVARAGLTGMLDGQATMARQALDQQARQAYRDAYGEEPPPGWTPDAATGPGGLPAATAPRTLTAQRTLADIEAQRAATSLADRIQTGQLSIAQAEQLMREAGQAGGQFVKDANTGRYTWQLTEAARSARAGERISEAGLTGMLDDRQTLEAQNAAFQRAIARGRETGQFVDPTTGWVYQTQAALEQAFSQKMRTSGLMGTLDGQQTLEAQNAELQRAIARGRETGQFVDPTTGRYYQTQAALEQAFSQKMRTSGLTGMLDDRQTLEAQNAELQRAIARGRETGQFVDPTTGRSYQTQAALEQAFSQKMRTSGLTGMLDDRQTLAKTGQEADIELRRASTFGLSGTVAPGTETEESRRNRAVEGLQGRGIAVTEGNLAEEIRRSKVNEAIQAATTFGAGLVLPDGRPITVRNGRDAYDGEENYIGRYDPNDGTLSVSDGRVLKVQVPTLAQQAQSLETELGRREASRREQELYGGITTRGANGALTFRPTLLAQAQQFGQQATTAGLTGKLPLLRADGTPARDANGQQIYGDTLDAQRLGLQTSEAFGGKEIFRYNPDTGKTERAWQDTLSGGKLALDRQNSAMDRAAIAGRETGKFVDPDTGVSYNTQAALEQSFKQRTIMEELYGGYTDPNTKKVYLTLEGQLQASQLTGKVIDPTGTANSDGSPKLIDTIDALNAAVDRAAKQGAAIGTYTDPLTNLKSDTLQKKIVSLEEEGTYGGRFVEQEDGTQKWQGTLAWEQMDRNQKLAYATLAEDTRRTKVKEKSALADQLGWTDAAPGKAAWGDWAQAFRDSTEGKPYDVAMDLDGNGRVDLEDMRYGQTNGILAATGETFTTMQAKQVTSQINAVSKTLALDREKLTEGIRQFNKNLSINTRDYLTRARGYVYGDDGLPIEKLQPDESQAFTAYDATSMFEVLSKRNGATLNRADQGYNQAFDMNDDGQITMDELQETLDASVALASPLSTADDEKRYTAKKSQQSVSSLEREQFKDDQDRFNKSFDMNLSNFAEQLGLDKERLKSLDDATTAALVGTLATAVLGAAAAYLGRSKSTSDNTSRDVGPHAGVSFGTEGLSVSIGLGDIKG